MDILSKNQAQIMNMILRDGLSQVQIAARLQKSKQAISKTVKKLKKKGYLEGYKRGGLTKGGAVVPKGVDFNQKTEKKLWRYHALEFEIRPYYFTQKYYKLLKERGANSTKVGVWKYSLYYKKVIVWLESGLDFTHIDRNTSIRLAILSFNAVLAKIAHDCGFKVFKDRRAGIKLLKHELALTNAPEWQTITKDKVFLQFRGQDGRVWLQYDRSKGVREREYTHHKAIDDADTLEPYLNDLRDNNPLTNSQLTSRLNDTITAIEKLTTAVQTLANR